MGEGTGRCGWSWETLGLQWEPGTQTVENRVSKNQTTVRGMQKLTNAEYTVRTQPAKLTTVVNVLATGVPSPPGLDGDVQQLG